jgi:uncharacterized protein (TIRG00374 family)
MKKFILALFLLLGILFIYWRLAEVETIVETFRHGDWRFLLIGLGLECLWVGTMALSYKALYRSLGLKDNFFQLVIVALGANFVNIIAPTGGMSGAAVFMADARRRNYSSGRALVAGAMYVLFDYATFFCILALGLVVLFRRNHLTGVELTTSGIFIVVALVLGALIYLGMRSNKELELFLTWIIRKVNGVLNPIFHREVFSEKHAISFAQELSEGVRILNKQPDKMAATFGVFFLKQAILIAILFLSFLAYQVPVSLGTLIAGFAMATLSLIVSPTPAGLGIVEGAMALVLVSLYVPNGAALIITLTYRGFTFWFPLLLGMIAFRVLQTSQFRRAESSD